MRNGDLKIARTAVSSVLLLLAGCGGGGSGTQTDDAAPPAASAKIEVVSFGDSLSDVGTYAPIADLFDGGRFTTNPGQVWTQDVAQHYGGSLNAAYTIGLTQNLTAQGGYGYAEGGATVDTRVSGWLVNVIGNVEMPVADQVTSYLTNHKGFNSNQLVLVWGGANDVLRAGSSAGAQASVEAAANKLAQVIAQIVLTGAKHVVVVNIPDIGATPEGLTSLDGGAILTEWSQLFNTTLSAALQQGGLTGKVIQVDSYTWMNQLIANYKANGFVVSNSATACNPNTTTDDTSLLCSPPNYATPNADQTYMFADSLHFTTRMHALFAELVEQQIALSGLGP